MPRAELIPNQTEWQVFQLFREDKALGEVQRNLSALQRLPGHEQRAQEGLLHVPCSDDPRSCPADGRVEKIQSDPGPIKEVREDKLIRYRLKVVVEKDHVIAVPPHGARHMEEDFIQRKGHRTQLVGDALGGMEMPHVEAQKRSFADRVAHLEFVASDGAGLNSNPKQLAFHGIDHISGLLGVPEHRV